MSKSSFVQTTFHGGEWSPFFQGRMDHPKFKTAMNTCRNAIPMEEGACVRRPGTRLIGPTYKGYPARLFPISFQATMPFQLEFTDSTMRFFHGNLETVTPEVARVISVSSAKPAVVTLQSPVPWATGDEIRFIFDSLSSPLIGQLLRQRRFMITAVAPAFLPAAWSAGATYGYGEMVTTVGPYDSGHTYAVGDLATYSNLTYTSLTNGNTGSQPNTNPGSWAVTANVLYSSLLYGNINSPPASTPLAWAPAVSGALTSFSLADSLTGTAFDGSAVNWTAGNVSAVVLRTLRISTPYDNGLWFQNRLVQSQDQGLVLNKQFPPQMLEIAPVQGAQQQPIAGFGPQAASATMVPVTFVDGPYLDPVPFGIATLTGLSGTVTMTVAFSAWDATITYAFGDFVSVGGVSYQAIANSLNQTPPNTTYWKRVPLGTEVSGDPNAAILGFQSTDVKRLVRLFSTPAVWDAATTYTNGQVVYYNNVVYQAVHPTVGVTPDVVPVGSATLAWNILPTGAIWTWGSIVSVTGLTTVTVAIQGPSLLYSIPCSIWRLGVYSATTGWPSCGTFYQNRFWFGGALPNRFDGCQTGGTSKNGTVNMAPTAEDGTVGDSNGISYTLESKDLNELYWFEPDHAGLLVGTRGGEWLISASTLNDPLTPTSMQAQRVTKYGCADIEPRRTGIALVFVQRYGRRLMEMLADVFTGRYIAPHLTEAAKHLTTAGIAEIGYQEELAPLIWVRTLINSLVGATYRRISAFTTEVPAFIGWHRHDLGTKREIESIAVGGNQDDNLDTVGMITNDPAKALRHIEVLTQIFDEDDSLYDAWFLDGGMVPDGMYQDTVGDTTGQRFTGLFYLIGQKVTVFAGGLDVGDFTVDGNGTVFVPYGTGVAPVPIEYTKPGAGAYAFTQAYVLTVINQGINFRNGGMFFYNCNTLVKGPRILSDIPYLVAAPVIQAFVPTLVTLTGANSFGITIDWGNNLLYLYGDAGSDTGLRKFDMATTTELSDPLWATIGVAAGPANLTMATNQSAANPTIYMSTGSTNFSPVVAIDEMTLTAKTLAAPGVASSGGPVLNTPPSTGIVNPGMAQSLSMCVVPLTADWLVSVGTYGTTLNNGDTGAFIAGNALGGNYQGQAPYTWGMSYAANSVPSVCAGRALSTAAVTQPDGTETNAAPNVGFAFIVEGSSSGNFSNANIYAVRIIDAQPGQTVLNQDGSPVTEGFVPASINPPVVNYGAAGFLTYTDPIPSGTDNPGTTFNFLGVITPQMIDPTWTYFSAVGGAITDQMDNNVIFIAATTEAVTTQQYLVKASTAPFNEGSILNPSAQVTQPFGVIWTVPLTGDQVYVPGDQANKGQCKNGLFCLLGNTQTSTNSHITPLYVVDTVTGKYGKYNIPGIYFPGGGNLGGQSWDDTSNSIIFFGAYDASVTGAIARVNGAGSFSSSWCQFFVGTDLLKSFPGYDTSYTVFPGAFPCVVGSCYSTQGQLLRPALAPDTGVHMGLGFGKTRRVNRFAIQIHKAVAMQVGTDFGATLNPVYFTDIGGTQLQPTIMYSGVWRDSIASGYDFDSMLAWEVVRPYPATVVAYGGFIETTDV